MRTTTKGDKKGSTDVFEYKTEKQDEEIKVKSYYKLYDLDYLCDEEITENDLYWIFDTDSLLYSLIIGMFRYVGYDMSNKDILTLCRDNDRWMYEYFWTQSQRNEFRKKLIKLIKNIYSYKDGSAESKADWWLFEWGLTIKTSKVDKPELWK